MPWSALKAKSDSEQELLGDTSRRLETRMNIDDCATGNCSLNEKILAALGGAVAGFLGMKLWSDRQAIGDRLTEIRRIKRNPRGTRGGLEMTIDGVDYFILVEGMPEGKYVVRVERPYSETTDFVGIVEKCPRGFRAFPPVKYDFGIKSDLPSFTVEGGTLLRTLRKAVGYLGKPYSRAFRKSRAFKQAIGRQFSRELAA